MARSQKVREGGFTLSFKKSFANVPSSPPPHLLCSLQLPVCCCHDNLPPSFAIILCRYGGKKGEWSEGGKQRGTELIPDGIVLFCFFFGNGAGEDDC